MKYEQDMQGIDLRFLFIMYIPQSNPGACLPPGDLLRQSPRNNAWTPGSLNSILSPSNGTYLRGRESSIWGFQHADPGGCRLFGSIVGLVN